ncbi:hypothetical protein DFP72DRAFT_847954 [Ephemerocybe angulata]|uniref:Uncharacterized protein n=1 Tax=Ephemerocybe angulata TaxID=980116 RepID=A0A8H6I080_9AGAR|nr:hypothetical protein DFP72DRAFT_847954 [Tulosesus angulatus]
MTDEEVCKWVSYATKRMNMPMIGEEDYESMQRRQREVEGWEDLVICRHTTMRLHSSDGAVASAPLLIRLLVGGNILGEDDAVAAAALLVGLRVGGDIRSGGLGDGGERDGGEGVHCEVRW